MNKKQFRVIITRYIHAIIDDSWKGGGDPNDWPTIEARLKKAKEKYEEALNELFPEKK